MLKMQPFWFREISGEVINDTSKYLALLDWKTEFRKLFPSADAALFYLDPISKTEIPVYLNANDIDKSVDFSEDQTEYFHVLFIKDSTGIADAEMV